MNPKRKVLAVKIEGVYGTDSVPTEAADAVRAFNIQRGFEGARKYQPLVAKPTLGKPNQIDGGALGTISFDVEVKGSGTAGTAPDYGPAMRACGFDETIVAATSVTYAPVSTAMESVSAYLWEDGTLWKFTGCRGNVTGNFTTGQPGMLSFNFIGHYSGPTDVALPTPTLTAIVAPSVLGLSGFAVDGFAAKIAALSFEMSNEVGTPDDLTAADGYGEVTISDRDLKGSLDPIRTVIATYDWVAKWKADNAALLDTGVVGAVAGNRWQLTMPKVQYLEIGDGDRAGVMTHDIGFMGAEDAAGDDELSLALT